MKIARRVANVNPSLTLQITSLAKKMLSEGTPVVSFAAGEPDFDTPQYIKKEAKAAITNGFTKYTPVTGFPRLKEAICNKLRKDNHLSYTPDQIVVSCGAKHSIYNTIQALCQRGDEVLMGSPYWVSYPEMVSLAEAKVRIIRTTSANNFKLNKNLLERQINKKTKLLILNSPANPTGSVYSKKELQEIAQVVNRHNLYVLSDEIYEDLIYGNEKHVSLASISKQMFKRTIVVNGVSKSYAMTGWRIGYLASTDKKLIKAISSLQSHSTSNPCSISQWAAYCAISKPQKKKMQKMVHSFQERRDLMLGGLNAISPLRCIKPAGAFYIFCDISKLGLDSLTFSRKLLRQANVAVIPGIAFGEDKYIRLSFATNKPQIQEGIRRIKNWVGKS